MQIKVDFKRDLPLLAKEPSIWIDKHLNYSHRPDCLTGLALQHFANSKEICDQNNQAKFSMVFSQVYVPNLIFGQSTEIHQVDREEHSFRNQTHDVGLIYSCDNTWELKSK